MQLEVESRATYLDVVTSEPRVDHGTGDLSNPGNEPRPKWLGCGDAKTTTPVSTISTWS
jgi:hypothetical protein